MIKKLTLISILFFSGTPSNVFAFEFSGIKSGMTINAVARNVNQFGYELKSLNDGFGYVAIKPRKSESEDIDIYETYGFCHGRLITLSRSLDPDVDMIHQTKQFLELYGQPKVAIRSQAFSGPRGGFINALDMVWRYNSDEITVSYIPEGRDGAGKLRNLRAASLSFFNGPGCHTHQ